MSKTIEEKIAVMQHYANGGEVETKAFDSIDWIEVELPKWDWSNQDYRIKEQEKTVIIEKWLMRGDTGCCFILEGSDTYFNSYQNITKIRLLETYEVEL